MVPTHLPALIASLSYVLSMSPHPTPAPVLSGPTRAPSVLRMVAVSCECRACRDAATAKLKRVSLCLHRRVLQCPRALQEGPHLCQPAPYSRLWARSLQEQAVNCCA